MITLLKRHLAIVSILNFEALVSYLSYLGYCDGPVSGKLALCSHSLMVTLFLPPFGPANGIVAACLYSSYAISVYVLINVISKKLAGHPGEYSRTMFVLANLLITTVMVGHSLVMISGIY